MSADLARTLRSMGIRDERVLAAMAAVPRGLFVPEPVRAEAESDRPLPIGHGQTISQPYIVALMTEALALTGAERVLEVGTGSGYQAAILARLAARVYSIERVPELSERARGILRGLGVENVALRVGDGALGWPEEAPFDRIQVTAAPPRLPEDLIAQLAPGGRMVVPVGAQSDDQVLKLVRREHEDGLRIVTDLIPVRFVPLV